MTCEQLETVKKWIFNLNSGEYRQGSGNLKKSIAGNQHYCCLGVLCESIDETLLVPYSDSGFTFMGKGSMYVSPSWFEWNTGIHKNEILNLARMNDSGHSFREIASYLQETYLNG